MKVKRKIFL